MPRQVIKTPKEEYRIFSTRLKELMQWSKTTQTELSDYIGCTRQAISLYTTAQSVPDAITLGKLATFFEVSNDYLLGFTDTKKIKTTEADESVDNCNKCLYQPICNTYARLGVTDVPASDITPCELFKDKADVEEVKHGEWIKSVLNAYCSECKTEGSPQWKRCPVCEAKMDGGSTCDGE